MTGNVGWAQRISRHVTAAGSMYRGPAPARWPYPIDTRRAGTSRAAELCALDRCGQSIRYDKTILVGNGHTLAPRLPPGHLIEQIRRGLIHWPGSRTGSCGSPVPGTCTRPGSSAQSRTGYGIVLPDAGHLQRVGRQVHERLSWERVVARMQLLDALPVAGRLGRILQAAEPTAGPPVARPGGDCWQQAARTGPLASDAASGRRFCGCLSAKAWRWAGVCRLAVGRADAPPERVIEDAAHLARLSDLVCLPVGRGGDLLRHREVAGLAQHDHDDLDPLTPVVRLAELVRHLGAGDVSGGVFQPGGQHDDRVDVTGLVARGQRFVRGEDRAVQRGPGRRGGAGWIALSRKSLRARAAGQRRHRPREAASPRRSLSSQSRSGHRRAVPGRPALRLRCARSREPRAVPEGAEPLRAVVLAGTGPSAVRVVSAPRYGIRPISAIRWPRLSMS